MKRIIAIALSLLMLAAVAAACNGGNDTPSSASQQPPQSSSPPTGSDPSPGGQPSASPGGDQTPSGMPTLAADAAQRAKDAYAFIDKLAADAAQYDSSKAKYRYTLNCQDPATSAPGKFLYGWSDAVLIATEGEVFIEVGPSNAFVSGGSMAALDDLIAGAIDFVFTLPCYFKGYMPLTLAIQNPSLGIKNATVGIYSMWELYKASPEIQAEFADDGELLFVWANNPSPLSYKGSSEITDISQISGNIRGNNGPAQLFINEVGASVFSCPIGDVYTNVSTGVMDYLITDWHAIMSFSLFDEGVCNYYLDTNIGCSAYCLMANDGTWAQIERNGYADKIKSVSGDYMLNWIGIWEEYEANGRDRALSTGGTIYPPSGALAGQLQAAYDNVAKAWVAGEANPTVAQGVYDKAVEFVNKYNGIYG